MTGKRRLNLGQYLLLWHLVSTAYWNVEYPNQLVLLDKRGQKVIGQAEGAGSCITIMNMQSYEGDMFSEGIKMWHFAVRTQ